MSHLNASGSASCERGRSLTFLSVASKPDSPQSAGQITTATAGACLQVDCAYYTDDEIEVNEDPTASVRTQMESMGVGSLESACPTCFNNQRALWCAQTVPKCGSYASTVENVLLPALTQITRSQAHGQTPVEALSGAMPDLLAASSLSMPCRQVLPFSAHAKVRKTTCNQLCAQAAWYKVLSLPRDNDIVHNA